MKDRLSILRSAGRFPMGAPALAPRLPAKVEAMDGGRIRIRPYGAGGWRLRGWAVIPDEGRAADGIVIVRRGSGGELCLVTMLVPTHLRFRVAARFGLAALRSGFKGHYHRPQPGGLAGLEAYAIDRERGRAFPLVASDDLRPR